MAPFQTQWKPRVKHILVQHVLTSRLSVRAVHELAKNGQIRGVQPDEVPPANTLAALVTVARKEAELADTLKTADGMIGTLEDAHALSAKAIMEEAKRLTKRGKAATPAQWAALNKAIAEAAKARRALEGEDGRRRPRTPEPIAGDRAPTEQARGFLDGIDPDA